MSLSRPARFPLLKLPWLCIKDVVKCWNIFDIIFFALTSKKTRQFVKSFKIPLNGIRLSVSGTARMWLCGFSWIFSKPTLKSSFNHNSRKIHLMLQNNPIPLYISRTNVSLTSYTYGDAIYALKMAVEFLNEVFKCSIKEVAIEEDNFPLSGNIGVKSTENMCINQINTQPFGYAPNKKLKLLLENLEVTGTCTFGPNSTENDFDVDPKLFKCKKLVFRRGSAAWVTPEILMQFEVPQLKFDDCPFSVQNILSFVTNWLHSDNKKLEYLCIEFRRQISLDEFQTSKMELLPFSKRARIPISESFCGFFIHFSKGLEIVRHDGLSASMHVKGRVFLFYIWHDQSATTHN
ncbi:unnamed protein product [Caenorhabditis brenneri]